MESEMDFQITDQPPISTSNGNHTIEEMDTTDSRGQSQVPITIHAQQLYDRQVRLWGDAGQSSISAARACVIGSSGLGTEVLKSLVLAGIGHFHIIDSAVVGESDLGESFFVTRDQLGKPRAEVVAQMLAVSAWTNKHQSPLTPNPLPTSRNSTPR